MRGNAISIYTGSVRDNACKLSKNHCIKSEYMYVKIDGWCKQLPHAYGTLYKHLQINHQYCITEHTDHDWLSKYSTAIIQ